MNYKTYITLLAAPAMMLNVAQANDNAEALKIIDKHLQILKTFTHSMTQVNEQNAQEFEKTLLMLIDDLKKLSQKLSSLNLVELDENEAMKVLQMVKSGQVLNIIDTLDKEKAKKVVSNNPSLQYLMGEFLEENNKFNAQRKKKIKFSQNKRVE